MRAFKCEEMRRDFTINRYKLSLKVLMNQDFSFMRISNYLDELREYLDVGSRHVILRQDVDRLPRNSLAFARIQNVFGIKSTFYFRSVEGSFEPAIIEEIANLGHEVGYHYEDLSIAAQSIGQGVWGRDQRLVEKAQSTGHRAQSSRLSEENTPISLEGLRQKGKRPRDINTKQGTRNKEQLFDAAIESFTRNLVKIRKYADVKTICMHGSPRSRWDSRLLWKYYDYKDFGIECEPYFDLNMGSMFYLTDTGRRWDGEKYSIRDKATRSSFAEATEDRAGSRGQGAGNLKDKRQKDKDKRIVRKHYPGTSNQNPGLFDGWKVKPVVGSLMNMTPESTAFQAKYNFRSTNDIIRAVERGELPDKMMMTFHPHRWNEPGMKWWKEFVGQNIKNGIKYFIIKMRERN